ncbi:hypothetical protein ACIQPT_34770 [Streptomyces sp. NPDC091289]|uniref:hypothetical protein n=1 Tax=Streptomyces sp. NPDC091289 TaxID=3365989 RepID=UPI0038189420
MSALDRHCRRTVTGSNHLLRTYGQWLTPGEWRQTAARVAGSACTGLFVSSMAYGSPGLLWPLTGWWAVAGWRAGRQAEAGDESDDDTVEMTADDITALIRALVGDAKGVLLTAVRDHLEQLAPAGWTTKDVRELLNDCEIPIRPGVRTPAGNGPGIHRDDLPPLPATPPTPSDVVAAGQAANTNTNNVRVESHAGGAHITVTPARQEATR